MLSLHCPKTPTLALRYMETLLFQDDYTALSCSTAPSFKGSHPCYGLCNMDSSIFSPTNNSVALCGRCFYYFVHQYK